MLTDQDIDKLKAVFATKDDLNEMRADIKELQTDMTGFKADISGMKIDIVGIKSDIKALKAELKDDIATLSRRVDRSVDQMIEFVTISNAALRNEFQSQINELRTSTN